MTKPLRIAIDLPWDASAHMGTGVYSETMTRALAEAAPEFELLLITPRTNGGAIRMKNVSYHSTEPIDIRGESFRHVSLPSLLESLRADCLFAPATLLPLIKVCPFVATVHDTTFIEHPEYYNDTLVHYFNQWFKPTLRSADCLIAISNETKTSLMGLGVSSERITVIEQPIRKELWNLKRKEAVLPELAALGIHQPYFFHVSNLAPHKNVAFAIQAFSRYLSQNPTSEHVFILAGGGFAPNKQPDIGALADQHGVGARVRVLGRVADDALQALYQGCSAFLFPSLAEGWGLPVHEATAMGCRVLASPFVPAARQDQKHSLEIDHWARAMALPNVGLTTCASNAAAVAAQAGMQLKEILEATIHGRLKHHPLPSAFHEPSGNDPQSPAISPVSSLQSVSSTQFEIGYRADWNSPSGFGEAARATWRALAASKIMCNAISVPKDAIQIPELWDGPVRSNIAKSDLVIHHLPPDFYSLNDDGKHVGIFVWETDRLLNNDSRGARWNWIATLNRLDEIWVPSHFLVDVLKTSGVNTHIEVIPHPIDTEAYQPGAKRPPTCSLPSGFDPTWTVFLYAGTWDARKRPDVVVRAFTQMFSASDKTVLLIKSYLTGNLTHDKSVLEQWVAEASMSNAHVRVIPNLLSAPDMINLYRLANVFVTASCGEGFCLPAMQAMSCGVPVIAANWSAFHDIVSIPVRFHLKNVPDEISFPGYAPDQRWAEIDEKDLSLKMLWAHKNRRQLGELGRLSRTWALNNVAFAQVGNRLRDRIAFLLDSTHQPKS